MADFDSIEAQLDALDAKLDALEVKVEAERSLSRVCTTCSGVGYLINYNDAREETQVTCPLCGGAEKNDWGFQEAL